jgi:hypothetical protein
MSEERIPVHVRTIRVEAFRSGESELEMAATLVDERPPGAVRWFGSEPPPVVHDMRLVVRVRYPDLVVTAVGGDMASHPYHICREALPPLQRLVGMSVARGFTRAINERFGREHGCAHLTALIHALAPVVRQAAGAAFRHGSERADGAAPWWVNTCQAWREDGPLHRLLDARDEAGFRAMSAYGAARRSSG